MPMQTSATPAAPLDPTAVLLETIRALLRRVEVGHYTRRCACTSCAEIRRLFKVTKINMLIVESARAGLPLMRAHVVPEVRRELEIAAAFEAAAQEVAP